MADFNPTIVGFACNWCCYAGADLAVCAATGAVACRLVHRYIPAIPRRQTAIRPNNGPIAIGVVFGSGAGFLRNRVRCVIRPLPALVLIG